ncbi:MAG: DUF2059 domain-containing protein [Oceanicaulis sp.]
MVRSVFVAAALSLSICAPVFAQSDTPRTHAELAGALAERQNSVLSEAFYVGMVQGASSLTPDDEQRRRMRALADSIAAEIAPVLTAEYQAYYAETFTAAELEEILAFYDTPTGRKMLEGSAELGVITQRLNIEVMTPAIERRYDELSAILLGTSGTAPAGKGG